MKESVIEQYLRKRLRMNDGDCMKYVSPGNNGVPDRLCILPIGPQDAHIFFVETKAPRGKLAPIQVEQIKRLRSQGAHVHVAPTKEAVDALIEEELLWILLNS